MATNKKTAKKTASKSVKTKAKKINKKAAKPATSKTKASTKLSTKKNSGKKTAVKTSSKTTNAKATSTKIKAKVSLRSSKEEQKPNQSKSQKWSTVFVPLDDRILVRTEAASDKTPGGLFIPMSVEERPNRGAVLSVGRGHRDKKGRIRPLDVKVGDSVLYSAYAGTKTIISGEEFLILREADVLGVVNDRAIRD